MVSKLKILLIGIGPFTIGAFGTWYHEYKEGVARMKNSQLGRLMKAVRESNPTIAERDGTIIYTFNYTSDYYDQGSGEKIEATYTDSPPYGLSAGDSIYGEMGVADVSNWRNTSSWSTDGGRITSTLGIPQVMPFVTSRYNLSSELPDKDRIVRTNKFYRGLEMILSKK